MGVLKGNYIGFTYNGVHSSDLGIVRTSDGSRFNENLLPTMQDKTAQVPGGDGTYFFGSYFTQRQFNVSFAYDSLTEEQIARIKYVFGDKKVHDLIFDETPYKVYSAKVTGTATLKYIPFSEGETNRRYKGEGTIQFTCYFPFARTQLKWLYLYKQLPQYKDMTNEEFEKAVAEWQDAAKLLSGMRLTEDNSPDKNKTYYRILDNNTFIEYDGEDIGFDLIGNYLTDTPESLESAGNLVTSYEIGLMSGEEGLLDLNIQKAFYELIDSEAEVDVLINGEMKLWNPGDIEANFILSIMPEEKGISKGSISIGSKTLSWRDFQLEGNDSEVRINSKLNLVEGYDENGKKTGNIYNKYFNGFFFKIPVNKLLDASKDELTEKYEAPVMSISGVEKASIKYNYYYL